MMNVHIIAHTHDDPGWKITVDQYYYKREYIQWRLVNSKIDGAKGRGDSDIEKSTPDINGY